MPRINVNGREYDLVTYDDFTLDEAIIVERYTDKTLDQALPRPGEAPSVGLVKALIHISVARAEPDENDRSIGQAVGRIKYIDLQNVILDTSEVEDVPPPVAPVSSSSSADSGADSSPTGAPHPASTGEPGTGSPGSDTGATSVPRISAA